MLRVVHFEIHAEDPERAVRFYSGLFGWEISKWSGPQDYWLLHTGPDGQPGINGGLLRRCGPAPAEGAPVNGYVCTVEVPALDDYLARATAQGGSLAMPKMVIPGVGWLAYIKDTEGNLLGMLQPDRDVRA
jgi:predicted enzyme related to lactoylglutathione lyase